MANRNLTFKLDAKANKFNIGNTFYVRLNDFLYEGILVSPNKKIVSFKMEIIIQQTKNIVMTFEYQL